MRRSRLLTALLAALVLVLPGCDAERDAPENLPPLNGTEGEGVDGESSGRSDAPFGGDAPATEETTAAPDGS